MKTISFALLLTFVISVTSSPLVRRAAIPTVTNTSSSVTFIGNYSNGVETFFNIKFGQDTSGSSRFKAPQPFSYPNNTVVNATAPGAACPQQKVPVQGIPIFDNVTNISEDCLTLRVDRPANVTSNAKLPVMVWIYGGGFQVGQIYDSAYTPTGLVVGAALKKTPVIYVAMNYRVGIFGFASSPGLSQDDLNVGILDQRLALQWVKDNIQLFGGDPDDITIFGESAGANSVGIHLISFAGNTSMAPVFKRAIMQSGGPTSLSGSSGNTTETANNTATVINQLNCTSSTGNYTAEISCLRALPLDTILPVANDLALKLHPFGGFGTFDVVVPSTVIPAPPSTLLATGQFHKSISLISGWAENDGSLFTSTKIRSESDVRTWLGTYNLTNSSIDTVLALYPADSFPSAPANNITAQWFRASQMNRDVNDACPSVLINAAMANASSSNTTNYLYALNETLFGAFFAKAGANYLGVPHFSDIGFVFNQAAFPAYGASQEEIGFASRVSGSWAAFATSGNPVGPGNTTLSGWTQGATANVSSGYAVRILGGPRDGIAGIGDSANSNGTSLAQYNDNQLERCQFWNSMDVLQMLGT